MPMKLNDFTVNPSCHCYDSAAYQIHEFVRGMKEQGEKYLSLGTLDRAHQEYTWALLYCDLVPGWPPLAGEKPKIFSNRYIYKGYS